MRIPKKLVLGVGAGALVLGLAAVIALGIHSGSAEGRVLLLVKYFRALSSSDEAALEELTSPEFQSGLALGSLARGTYELYDFGEGAEGNLRFLLVTQAPDGEKRAVLGEMEFSRVGLSNRIDSIRRIEEGKRLAE